jgi:Ran GTPase-activating protein (RanGAP) involved in mRNA processing and transport
MMQNSFYFLNKLIEKQPPHNLEELRLTSCKLSQPMTDELLDLIKDDCSLKKLSIVNCGMHSSSVEKLKQFIDNSNYLVELDISWNNLNSSCMFELSEVFLANRKLQYLNLSFNNLKEPEPTYSEEYIEARSKKDRAFREYYEEQ